MRRAQMNLPALAVALLVVSTVAVLGFGMAERAYLSADRDADQRRVAVALAERLVGPETPLTARQNVLDADALGSLNATRLRRLFPVADGYDVRVRVGDRTAAAAGDPTGGETVRRIVLVEERTPVTLSPEASGDGLAVTLPRRSPNATVSLSPPEGTAVRTVRANDRVVLRNASGLAGRFEIRLSAFETTTLTFEADGPLGAAHVDVTYYPAETRKELLAVTVDG